MPGANAIENIVYDPLQFRTPLPHRVRIYPYGFPVDVASNAREALDAAHESFGCFGPRFDRPPLRVHVLVSEGGAGPIPDPVLRGQANLITWISDRDNHAAIDWRQKFGFSCVTRTTLLDSVFFRWHFLDALVYMLLELNYTTSLHAACVARDGAGVLLHAESGVGKSTLSYACARRGWTYVSDDASTVVWDTNGIVIGEPHHFRFRAEVIDLFPELGGRTAGRELDRKPTVEVFTRELPIRTAAESRVEHIAFLERGANLRPSMQRLARGEAMDRLLQELPGFDPDLDARRLAALESVAGAPAFHLRYSHFEEAVDLLDRIVGGSAA